MENCPTRAVLPLLGLAADNVMRDRYNPTRRCPVVPFERVPESTISLPPGFASHQHCFAARPAFLLNPQPSTLDSQLSTQKNRLAPPGQME
ncbi:MAG: hypothetical protein ACQESR_03530 [Planctomycetota bacterium]